MLTIKELRDRIKVRVSLREIEELTEELAFVQDTLDEIPRAWVLDADLGRIYL